MKKHDIEQWEKLGTNCKVAERMLLDLISEAQLLDIDKKTIGELSSAWSKIGAFKNKAEMRMFSEGTEFGNLGVFYGNSKLKYKIIIDETK